MFGDSAFHIANLELQNTCTVTLKPWRILHSTKRQGDEAQVGSAHHEQMNRGLEEQVITE